MGLVVVLTHTRQSPAMQDAQAVGVVGFYGELKPDYARLSVGYAQL